MQIVSAAMETSLRPELMSPFLSLGLKASQSRMVTTSEESSSPPPALSSKMFTKENGGSANQEYHCPSCKTVLNSQKDFTAHIRSHNEVKPLPNPNDPTGQSKVYYCYLCGKMLSSFSSLDRHMLVHSGERPYSCEKCGQTFTTNGNMHRHQRTHGNRDSRESDGSSGAPVGVGRPPRSGPGRRRKNPFPTGVGNEGPSSNIFNKTDVNDDNLSMNNDMFCPELPTNIPPSIPKLPFPELTCPICKDTVYSEYALETHISTFHQGVPCDECPNTFPSFDHLKLHKTISHHKSPFSLAAQLQMASQQHKQQFHHVLSSPPSSDKKSDSDVSPVKPPSIEKFLSSKDSDSASNQDLSEQMVDENDHLIREMKMKGEFPCRLCSSVSPNLRALKSHNKEHLNKPPYVCNVGNCTYSSSDKSTLIRHMRCHTGEKPFECKICNFGFTTKANCERHVKNKHSKSNREDIRESIVLHDSEENHSLLNNQTAHDDQKKQPEDEDDEEEEKPAKNTSKPPIFFAPYHSSLFRAATVTDEDEKPTPKRKEEIKVIETEKRIKKEESPLDLSRPSKKMKLQESLPPSSFFSTNLTQKEEEEVPLIPEDHKIQNPIPPRLPFLFPSLAESNFDFARFLLVQQELLRCQAAAEPGFFLKRLSNLQNSSVFNSPSPLLSPPLQNDKPLEDDFKLVIKDGIIMKKQKQRRYRKERPYACERCDAKFTLRSNMERHVKNQHQSLKIREDPTSGGMKDEEEDDEEEEDEPINVIDDDETSSRSGKLLSCPYCDRKFTWTSDFKDHLLTQCNKGGPLIFGSTQADPYFSKKHDNEDNNNSREDCSPLNESSTPFKCHLCDEGSFPDREEALVHLQTHHTKEYRDLVERGAFETALNEDMETNNEAGNGNEEAQPEARGKFPDYGNRKIICLFCMRKFWSAEDLRRHVRTHTGERPYSCDICQRRFSLKHSMLRHRKKHDSGVSSDSDSETGRSSSPSSNLIENDESKKKRANLMDTINKLSAASHFEHISS